jgi:ATP/maltotriose-dependent transcriptional regulator MalT
MIPLAAYQRTAVHGAAPEGLAPSVARLLSITAGDRLIVLSAPTGSGKTVMLAAAFDASARRGTT